MEESDVVNSVARAIMAALDWTSSPDTRNAAVSYLESFKAGDIRVLASTSFALVKKEWSTEIRLHALKMLQHLVRLRWGELNLTEKGDFANVAVSLMSEVSNSSEQWALKSQMAALVAEMVRREGLNLWQELLPSLISLSNRGPTQAELVSMMLRWLPEDITVHNEDLEGERRRDLLRVLAQSLPEILPLLYTLLERHFGAAVNEAGRQQFDVAKQHAATVTATLNAINAYAEWAPVPDLLKYGIINGCGFLLSSRDFRLHACEFFKLVSPRKRPTDETASEFDAAIINIFQILVNVSRDFLFNSTSSATVIDESDFEFFECVCESMVSLGSSNLQCIIGDSTTLSFYLQQMLAFYQHKKLTFHYQSLLFWLALMRDVSSKPKTVAHKAADGSVNVVTSVSGQSDNEKKKISTFVSDDLCSSLLEIAFLRMLKKEKVLPGSAFFGDTIELWNDDFEGKGDFSQYRSKLLELLRFVTSVKPLVAASKISERITTIVNSVSRASLPAKELAVMESLALPFETIVSSVFDGSIELGGITSETQLALCRIIEGLVQQLLALKWTEPTLVQVLGHYLDALGPFLKYFPNAVGSVINKLFELLTSLPYEVKDPSTSIARHARLQICTSFIRIAKAADKSLLPHMKGIADTMAYLQREGRLLRAEHNILGEAFLVMASAAGVQEQQEVLAWFLEPLSKQWIQLEWQNAYLSEPAGLVRLCSDTQFMWSLFHTVTFFEKALKRSGGFKKGIINSQNNSKDVSPVHPMASHLSWMLPPLLKLLRAVHSFWSPHVIQSIPGEIKAALVMSDAERTTLLGEVNPKFSKNTSTSADRSQMDSIKEGHTESNEGDIRNWLKGIRDSGYSVLGLSTTIGVSFFKCLDAHTVSLALMENIQSMEFRHIRQLVHLVLIPCIKWCPLDLWEDWVKKLLHPLLLHSQQVLSCSWASLLHEGRANVPDLHGTLAGSDLKVEVIEEKLLRDLTREICSLLSVLASPVLNPGLPSLEQSGQFTRVDSSSLNDLVTFASSSMIGFVLNHKGLAVPALQITLDAFKWTDGESMIRVSSFSGAVIHMAIVTNNMELQQYVCKDLFFAIIQGLGLESNAIISAELVGLSREIFMYFSERDPAPKQILLSLPCIKPQDLLAFEEAITKTPSPKEQRQLMKSLLMLATENQLKALAAQKSVNVITNVSARPRSLVPLPESKFNEGDSIGLAAIL